MYSFINILTGKQKYWINTCSDCYLNTNRPNLMSCFSQKYKLFFNRCVNLALWNLCAVVVNLEISIIVYVYIFKKRTRLRKKNRKSRKYGHVDKEREREDNDRFSFIVNEDDTCIDVSSRKERPSSWHFLASRIFVFLVPLFNSLFFF